MSDALRKPGISPDGAGLGETRPDDAEPMAVARWRIRLVAALPLLVFAGLAALFYVGLYAGDPSRIPSALVGKAVPRFDLPRLEGLQADGGPVPALSSEDLRGQVSVVNVWASWCVPCRDEHPVLMSLARDKRFRLVGINYKDQPENARRFLGVHGNPFRAVGVDASGRTAIDWGVYGVPETFVVGPDGRILYKHVGPLTEQAVRDVLGPVIEKALAAG
jgi:cytochrome c biogenesis protein CcmG/thiol:disulfide interchange protein DsbE